MFKVAAAALPALTYLFTSKRLPILLIPLNKFLPVPAINPLTPAGDPAPVEVSAADPAANIYSSIAIDVIIPAV